EDEHGLTGSHDHGHDEAQRDIGAVVGVPIVDDVAAGFPECLAGLDHSRRLALQLEDHFALEDVAETRPARVAVWRDAGMARGVGDPRRHYFAGRSQKRRGAGGYIGLGHSSLYFG